MALNWLFEKNSLNCEAHKIFFILTFADTKTTTHFKFCCCCCPQIRILFFLYKGIYIFRHFIFSVIVHQRKKKDKILIFNFAKLILLGFTSQQYFVISKKGLHSNQNLKIVTRLCLVTICL
jgi:hypothetical protein